jgi:hypothetical protein
MLDSMRIGNGWVSHNGNCEDDCTQDGCVHYRSLRYFEIRILEKGKEVLKIAIGISRAESAMNQENRNLVTKAHSI